MEALLNTIWLLVAIGAFLFWKVRVKDAAWRFDHNQRRRNLALAVVLVFLFPVISLTDDLHAEQAAMEESSRSVIKARSLLHRCLHAARRSFVPDVTTDVYSFFSPQVCFGTVILTRGRVVFPSLISAHDGRSPPFRT